MWTFTRHDQRVADGHAFNGPWAAEFAEAYRSSDDAQVRLALSDERITGAEYAETKAQILRCVRGLGVDAFFERGSLQFGVDAEPLNDEIDSCLRRHGVQLLALAEAMEPQRRDGG